MAEPQHNQPLESLRAEMRSSLRTWSRATRNYGFTYYASRIVLIISSAVVAAKATLADGKGHFLVAWVPLLALAVAVLTALDTWLKPQQRWKGFMSSRDQVTDLILRAEDPEADIAQLREDLKNLRQRHVQANVF